MVNMPLFVLQISNDYEKSTCNIAAVSNFHLDVVRKVLLPWKLGHNPSPKGFGLQSFRCQRMSSGPPGSSRVHSLKKPKPARPSNVGQGIDDASNESMTVRSLHIRSVNPYGLSTFKSKKRYTRHGLDF
jgi:hypothetical protein